MVVNKKNPFLTIFDFKFRRQLLATLVVQIITLAHGIGVGWIAPTLTALQSVDTPQSFPVSVIEASWIGSIYGLGSISGTILFGFIGKLGRRWSLCLVAIPNLICWILVYVAQAVEILYVARFMHGLTAGGIYVVSPIYLSEIADPSIRGALSSMSMISVGIGILLGFIMPSYLNYYLVPCIVVVLPLSFLLLASSLLPETAQFLLRANKIEEAEKSFNFYKNIRKKETRALEVQKPNIEFEALKMLILKDTTQAQKATFKDFFTKPALKAYLCALMFINLVQFSGSFAMMNYLSDVFVLSGSTIDANFSTIINGVFQLIGYCLVAVYVDSFGRKALLLCSSSGMTVGLIVYGLFIQFASSQILLTYNWLPMLIMGFVTFFAAAGVIPLFFVSIVEILPLKIRDVATSACMCVYSLFAFVALKLLPILLHDIGVPYTMYVLAAFSIVSLTYLAIFQRETKGISLDVE